jgi:aquaporin Z
VYGDYLRRGTAEFIGAFTLIFIGAAAVMLSGATGIVGIAIAHGLAIALMVTAPRPHLRRPLQPGGHARVPDHAADRPEARGRLLARAVRRGDVRRTAPLVDLPEAGDRSVAHRRAGAELGDRAGAGLVLEAILTFFLVLAVFATAVDPRGAFKAVAGFGIGLVVTMGILCGGPLTGAAMNPARAFGPELVANFWRRTPGSTTWDRPVARSSPPCSTSCSSCVSRSSRSARSGPACRSPARAISPSPSRYARSVAIQYDRRGEGPLLFCHPGGPGFSGAELGDLGGLGATRTLLLLHPRGTRESGPADSYALDDYVADLEELRASLGEEQIDLLGFSHGGMVAAAYAAAHRSACGSSSSRRRSSRSART